MRIRSRYPSEQFLRGFFLTFEAASERIQPNLAHPFEIVRAPGSFDIRIDFPHVLDRAIDLRSRSLAARDAPAASISTRSEAIRESREHLTTIAQQRLLSVDERPVE